MSSNYFNCQIANSKFDQFLTNPINIVSQDYLKLNQRYINQEFTNQVVRTMQSSNDNTLEIQGCNFKKCVSNDNAGAIKYISRNGALVILDTSFVSCSSTFQAAAVYFNGVIDNQEPTTTGTKAVSSKLRYCCFNHCSGISEGVIWKISSSELDFNSSFALDCSNHQGSSGYCGFFAFADKMISNFFNQSKDHISSQSGIFFTTIPSISCQYHTMVEHYTQNIVYQYKSAKDERYVGTYANFNFYNNTLRKSYQSPNGEIWGGLILIAGSVAELNNCAIFHYSREAVQYHFVLSNGVFQLNNCIIDENSLSIYGNIVQNNITKVTNLETLDILIAPDIYSCRYLLTQTYIFTESEEFSNSNEFSSSSQFTKSSEFSSSFEFTKSSEFTKYNVFTKSLIFTPTKDFTPSSSFSSSILSHIFSIPKSIQTANSNPSSPISNTLMSSNHDYSGYSISTQELTSNPLADNPKKNKLNIWIIIAMILATIAIVAALVGGTICYTRRMVPIIPNSDDDEEIETNDPLAGIDTPSESSMNSNDDYEAMMINPDNLDLSEF